MSAASSTTAVRDSERLSLYVKEYRQLEESSKRSFDMMAQSLASPFTVSERQCEEARANVVACYQQNGEEPYRCKEVLDVFAQCSDRLLNQHLLLVGDFLKKRETFLQNEDSSK